MCESLTVEGLARLVLGVEWGSVESEAQAAEASHADSKDVCTKGLHPL
jgi:hypothetical protein